MAKTLTAKDFAGGVSGGHAYDFTEDGTQGMLGYCICGWVGPLRTKGGYIHIRAQSLRDYDRHALNCDVQNRRKAPPDWGTIKHVAHPENEIGHSHHSWRAKCDCGWYGKLYWSDDAMAIAATEAGNHMNAGIPPVDVSENYTVKQVTDTLLGR